MGKTESIKTKICPERAKYNRKNMMSLLQFTRASTSNPKGRPCHAYKKRKTTTIQLSGD